MTRLRKPNLPLIIHKALQEDDTLYDITTSALIEPHFTVRAVILAKAPCVLSGLRVVQSTFKLLDPSLEFSTRHKDADFVKKGEVVARICGRARSILSAERVALNFLSQLSGIATLTNQFVKSVVNTKAKILDTRKTTPLLRSLEKYAVRCGGGFNHRTSLKDAVLIKDNHKKAYLLERKGVSLDYLVRQVRKHTPARTKIEIEVENVKEFKQVLCSPVDIIMLDNMPLKAIRQCTRLKNKLNPKVKLEVSGNVSLANVRRIAKSGVDFISVGVLTHSSPAIDFSLEVI
jgi:nicotinate-nucleotide pyrophosphorylase (carboxylating)